ncbi:predicted protein [Plenodomus lingam JN3]|uniref:Predicted protein n=1 Tax=Leptosphaeria maculans (strain JN3 / isolate v23.1.3 / race Av1-4-5-6-7-8) TaxID=985895 RepID=E5AA89_LEPMJ|nr:predicted protein [Plenodomus lingam JN3]CBY00580.1 predicted protein [Plenodomus lingam JN3]
MMGAIERKPGKKIGGQEIELRATGNERYKCLGRVIYTPFERTDLEGRRTIAETKIVLTFDLQSK